ncbi:hypothetical protein GCM10027275_25100 [Rhabdobacter roseus]|uniref:Uncharacterized protein n=1 Tax=Rhabdobacter roseus TaxID=1655419 RepID=A0A840TWY4_9BACT|nr:hypothetical protein [Rhabdobacter roseus]MBB5284450.1 hypothetical protein [Rhabdobacter roseus]
MKHRRFVGQQTSNRKPLTEEQKAKQKSMASCYMVVKFHDGNQWSKWSNEWAQPRIRNINDAINEMFRIMEQYFKGRVHSAAIFDTRMTKDARADNKIYQYENGCWQIEKPFTW